MPEMPEMPENLAPGAPRQATIDGVGSMARHGGQFPICWRGPPRPARPGALQTEAASMTQPNIVTQAEWLTARRALLEQEKARTRQKDDMAKARGALP